MEQTKGFIEHCSFFFQAIRLPCSKSTSILDNLLLANALSSERFFGSSLPREYPVGGLPPRFCLSVAMMVKTARIPAFLFYLFNEVVEKRFFVRNG